MDWQSELFVGCAAGAVVAAALGIRWVRRQFRPVPPPATGYRWDDQAQAVMPRNVSPELHHYWVPNGATPAPDGKWWVYLGAERSIFGFTKREDAVYQADQLNRRESRGPHHPSRKTGILLSDPTGVIDDGGAPRQFVQVSTPNGLGDDFARRYFGRGGVDLNQRAADAIKVMENPPPTFQGAVWPPSFDKNIIHRGEGKDHQGFFFGDGPLFDAEPAPDQCEDEGCPHYGTPHGHVTGDVGQLRSMIVPEGAKVGSIAFVQGEPAEELILSTGEAAAINQGWTPTNYDHAAGRRFHIRPRDYSDHKDRPWSVYERDNFCQGYTRKGNAMMAAHRMNAAKS